MSYGTINADVIGTSVANSSLGAGNSSAMKNRIINGDFRIDQRNAGASVNNNTTGTQYTLDRWLIYGSQSAKFSVQQNAGSVTPPAGFKNYLGITSLSAYSITSTDEFDLIQRIEGFNTADLDWGTANAKTVTLSFWVRSSLTGTFGGVFGNSALNRVYPFSYTISAANTWEQKSITITGDTTGTWVGATNGTGIQIYFSIGAGANLQGTAGVWGSTLYLAPTGQTSVVGTNGATFYITGVQLEVGSSATGFEYRQYGQELALCQRYYYRNVATNANAGMGCAGAFGATNTLVASVQYPVQMRSAPTASQSGCSNGNGAIASAITSITTSYYGVSTALVQFVSGSVFSAGQGGYVYAPTTSAYVDFSAEL